MLTEQRYEKILQLLDVKKSVTVTELKQLLETSESTIRRDINALHRAGRLTKVFGGALALDHISSTCEQTVAQKLEEHAAEKAHIARLASAYIDEADFIYLDAGTTTLLLPEYLAGRGVQVVTNGVTHAQRLAALGVRVTLLGGELKNATDALVGPASVLQLRQYHFTRGFFGTNGVSLKAGFTTPDQQEAIVKRLAMERCRERYVLADSSKFSRVSAVSFGDFDEALILTDSVKEGYTECKNIRAT